MARLHGQGSSHTEPVHLMKHRDITSSLYIYISYNVRVKWFTLIYWPVGALPSLLVLNCPVEDWHFYDHLSIVSCPQVFDGQNYTIHHYTL